MDQQDSLWLILLYLAFNSLNKNKEEHLLKSQEENNELLRSFYPEPINPLNFATFDPEKVAYEKKIQEECENVEWEGDMGAHIPFCKLDGQFCNMQCIRRI